MGKVRTEHVKRIARELIRCFPKKFSGNFEENKRVVSILLPEATTRVRNRVAGYITHIYGSVEPSSSGEGEEDSE